MSGSSSTRSLCARDPLSLQAPRPGSPGRPNPGCPPPFPLFLLTSWHTALPAPNTAARPCPVLCSLPLSLRGGQAGLVQRLALEVWVRPGPCPRTGQLPGLRPGDRTLGHTTFRGTDSQGHCVREGKHVAPLTSLPQAGPVLRDTACLPVPVPALQALRCLKLLLLEDSSHHLFLTPLFLLGLRSHEPVNQPMPALG